MMLNKIPYRKPLVIGTGGGNDIVSACLVVANLRDKGIIADVAGVCSPGAVHTYEFSEEMPINVVTSGTRRYIHSKNVKEISFLDSKIPELLGNEGISSRVYHLSFRHGTRRLIEDLGCLVKERGYDGIIAVDVGGDILARGKKDPTILSPLMDFSTLYVLSKLSTPSTLVEFGLQTDGELRPQGCAEILDELRSGGIMLDEQEIKLADKPVQVFKRINDRVKHVRSGHAVVMALKTLESSEDLHEDYRFGVRVLDQHVTYNFPITLESKYFGKVFIIDLKKLAETRKLAFPYKNTLELFLKTKQIVDTKTEMDLLYNRDSGVCLWLAMTCPQIQNEQRIGLLNYGLDNLSQHADVALLWKADAENRKIRLAQHSSQVGDFVFTSSERDKLKQIEEEIQHISE